jgi:glycosyltransferase involved in cell wall biosynthesis
MSGISLGIPLFRSECFLAELLDRLSRLAPSPREIIFLDDASPDNCLAMASEFVASAPCPVKLVRNTENQGIAAAYNRLATEASSEWLHILDADDYPVETDFYARVARGLEPKTLLAVAGIESTSRTIKWGNRIFARVVPTHPPQWWPLLGSFATRSGVIYRREAISAHQFPDPAYPGSDVVHLLQLRASGRSVFIRDAHIHYRIHEGATSSKQRDYSVFVNKMNQFDLPTRLAHRLDLALRTLGQRWDRP